LYLPRNGNPRRGSLRAEKLLVIALIVGRKLIMFHLLAIAPKRLQSVGFQMRVGLYELRCELIE
jgi:hypothetical protein